MRRPSRRCQSHVPASCPVRTSTAAGGPVGSRLEIQRPRGRRAKTSPKKNSFVNVPNQKRPTPNPPDAPSQTRPETHPACKPRDARRASRRPPSIEPLSGPTPAQQRRKFGPTPIEPSRKATPSPCRIDCRNPLPTCPGSKQPPSADARRFAMARCDAAVGTFGLCTTTQVNAGGRRAAPAVPPPHRRPSQIAKLDVGPRDDVPIDVPIQRRSRFAVGGPNCSAATPPGSSAPADHHAKLEESPAIYPNGSNRVDGGLAPSSDRPGKEFSRPRSTRRRGQSGLRARSRRGKAPDAARIAESCSKRKAESR